MTWPLLYKESSRFQVKSSVQNILLFKLWSSGFRPMYFNDLFCCLHLYNTFKVKHCWHFTWVLTWELCIWQQGHWGNWHNENAQGDNNPRYPRITLVDLLTCILMFVWAEWMDFGDIREERVMHLSAWDSGEEKKKAGSRVSVWRVCHRPESMNIYNIMWHVSVLDTSSTPN